MKRPNITPGPWATAREFPGCVVSGKVEDTPRGKSVMVVCKVQGNCLPTYRGNLAAIAAVPDLLEALELARDLIAVARSRFPKSVKHRDTYKLCLADAVIGSALAKAGYTL